MATVIIPKLIKRKCSGWLAVSPKGARFMIGVVAETEELAALKFKKSYERMAEILDGPRTVPEYHFLPD